MAFDLLDRCALYNILAIREEVFNLEQKCTEPNLDGLDKKAIHIVAMENDTIYGTARILPPGLYKPGVVSFGRLAIKKEGDSL